MKILIKKINENEKIRYELIINENIIEKELKIYSYKNREYLNFLKYLKENIKNYEIYNYYLYLDNFKENINEIEISLKKSYQKKENSSFNNILNLLENQRFLDFIKDFNISLNINLLKEEIERFEKILENFDKIYKSYEKFIEIENLKNELMNSLK